MIIRGTTIHIRIDKYVVLIRIGKYRTAMEGRQLLEAHLKGEASSMMQHG